MRIAQDSKVDSSQANQSDIMPVITLAEHPPILGSIALNQNTVSPYYADGTQWLPFGGGGGSVIQSGAIGITATGPSGPSILTDGVYHRILFDADMSPLTPPHPSFTIDTANSLITINQNGNYLLYYHVTPANTGIAQGGTQPEQYVAQLQTTTPTPLSLCAASGSFRLIGGALQMPAATSPENVPYVSLQGSWSGFLPAGTSVETVVSIVGSSPVSSELFFGEGGKMQYMGIVKLF